MARLPHLPFYNYPHMKKKALPRKTPGQCHIDNFEKVVSFYKLGTLTLPPTQQLNDTVLPAIPELKISVFDGALAE